MNKMKKEGRTLLYATDFKIAICREYLTSSLGYGKLAVKYNLKNGDTVKSMVKWYRAKYPDIPVESSVQQVESITPSSTTDKQLKEAHLKIVALELLIANASKELGVDIVKKLGTKQSLK